jgi:hypothetical protein
MLARAVPFTLALVLATPALAQPEPTASPLADAQVGEWTSYEVRMNAGRLPLGRRKVVVHRVTQVTASEVSVAEHREGAEEEPIRERIFPRRGTVLELARHFLGPLDVEVPRIGELTDVEISSSELDEVTHEVDGVAFSARRIDTELRATFHSAGQDIDGQMRVVTLVSNDVPGTGVLWRETTYTVEVRGVPLTITRTETLQEWGQD